MSLDGLAENIAESPLYSPAEERMRQLIEAGVSTVEKPFPRYASFVILTNTRGEILLARRNTSPHVGLFSAIGGKLDSNALVNPSPNASFASQEFKNSGLEVPLGAAFRELREETFKDIREEILRRDVVSKKLGFVYDAVHNSYCRVYLFTIPDQFQFSISERELQGIPEVITAEVLAAGQVNDLTALFLVEAGLVAGATRSMLCFPHQPMTRMAMPSDISRCQMRCSDEGDRARLELGHILDEPGYIIH